MSVRRALDAGRREALVALSQQLADEVDTTVNGRDRLATARVLLSALAQLSALDAVAARQAVSGSPAGGQASSVDELLARRLGRRGRRHG